MRGDFTVAVATVTPARGVVITPMTNIGLGDRERGTVTVTTTLGLWRKLERIERNPRVAIAFHTRQASASERPEYVLLQGKAAFSWTPDRAWLESIGESWERLLEPRAMGPLWDRWLHVFHWERVGVETTPERVVVWSDLRCAGAPEAHGAPLPSGPEPQRPPARGTGPRVNAKRAAARAKRFDHVLLGWVGADGLPVVVSASVGPADERGIRLELPAGLVPPGGRRAGLCAHSFSEHLVVETQRIYTGWLTAEADGGVLYAPHTEQGFRLPKPDFARRLGIGLVTRRGYRRARRAGLLAGPGSHP